MKKSVVGVAICAICSGFVTNAANASVAPGFGSQYIDAKNEVPVISSNYGARYIDAKNEVGPVATNPVPVAVPHMVPQATPQVMHPQITPPTPQRVPVLQKTPVAPQQVPQATPVKTPMITGTSYRAVVSEAQAEAINAKQVEETQPVQQQQTQQPTQRVETPAQADNSAVLAQGEAIQYNSARIDTNGEAISANREVIQHNSARIDQNTARLDSAEKSIKHNSDRIEENSKKIKQIGDNAAAMSSLHFDANRDSWALSTGTANGEGAGFAAGVQKGVTEHTAVSFQASTDSFGGWMAGAGVHGDF